LIRIKRKVDFDIREKSCDGNIFFCDKPERQDLRGGHPMPYYYSHPGGHPEFIFSPPIPPKLLFVQILNHVG
jgi:hypothetical protein